MAEPIKIAATNKGQWRVGPMGWMLARFASFGNDRIDAYGQAEPKSARPAKPTARPASDGKVGQRGSESVAEGAPDVGLGDTLVVAG